MAYPIKRLIPSLLLAGIILLAGCSGSSSSTTPPPAQTPAQANDPSSTPPSSQAQSGPDTITTTETADNLTTGGTPAWSPSANRVDVIYFHVNQRCPTCICFEDRVNHVIETDFKDAIASGKLTYRVLNAQQEQNAEIARKYGVVGSQLFINTVINGKDSIKDIQEIWKWNCRGDAPIFDRKVKGVIEGSLKGLP